MVSNAPLARSKSKVESRATLCWIDAHVDSQGLGSRRHLDYTVRLCLKTEHKVHLKEPTEEYTKPTKQTKTKQNKNPIKPMKSVLRWSSIPEHEATIECG